MAPPVSSYRRTTVSAIACRVVAMASGNGACNRTRYAPATDMQIYFIRLSRDMILAAIRHITGK